MNQNDKKPVRRSAGSPVRRSAAEAPVPAAESTGKPVRAVKRKRPAAAPVKTPKPTRKEENTAFSSLLKAIVYIVFVLVISGALSYFGITVGNDVFAFVKEEREVEITTYGDSVDVDQLAELLGEQEVIRYPKIFSLYAKFRKKDGNLIATTEKISTTMGYDELLAAFKKKAVPRAEVKVTIPEGYTVDDIIRLLTEDYHIGTKQGFVEAINNYDYDYWFIEEMTGIRPGRKYRLEGYLYPDTYIFYTDSAETTVINKMLSNFDKKFDPRFKAKAAEMGWTVDDVVILASMIQMEGKYETEYGNISSVFHNRLNHPNMTLGKLESDATVQYFLPERMENLTKTELETDSPYNTHMYAGLPPGPISNPTTYAINYALYPNDTSYYYFLVDNSGKTVFASTYAEHLRNAEAIRNGA